MNVETCPRCGVTLLANAKFCGSCSLQVRFDQEAPGLQGSEWKPAPHEFAARIQPQALKALLTKGVNLDESQTGLLFESGRFEHELKPGRQAIETLPDRIRRFITGETASAVVIRGGLYPINVSGQTLSSDGYEVSFGTEIGLLVGSRNQFYVNLMQSRDVVTNIDLLKIFGEVVRQRVFGIIGSCTSQELISIHPELQQRLTDAIYETVVPVAERWGLEVSYVSPPSFNNQKLSEFHQERAQLIRDLRDQKLRQRYEEAREKIELTSFQTGRALAEAKFKEDIEEAERTGEFEKLTAELKHRQDYHRLQLDAAMETAIREYKQNQEQEKSLYEHLLAVNEANRERELADLRFKIRKQSLEQQTELDETRRSSELTAAQQELEAQLKRIETEKTARLKNWRSKKAAFREEALLDAKNHTDIDQIRGDSRRDQESKDFDQRIHQERTSAETEIEGLKGLSNLQVGHQKGLLEIDRLKRANESESARADHELQEASKKNDRQHELEKMRLLAEMPEMVQLTEMAKLAVASPAMTASFGDVMKMAMAKGMTPEQLELIAAQQSPEVARALQERYKAEASSAAEIADQKVEMYERIITEIKSANSISHQQLFDLVNRIERMGVNGQEMLRDVGVSANSSKETVSQEVIQSLVKEIEKMMNKKNPGSQEEAKDTDGSGSDKQGRIGF